MKQLSSNKLWRDEAGIKIPYSRVTKTERLMENKADTILRSAKSLNQKLKEFKELITKACDDVWISYIEGKDLKTTPKGNFTWYNFDRSVKIEVSISELIKFDDMAIMSAKELLFQFLDETIESKHDFVRDIIQDAFQTSKGKLDPRKILGLVKYKSRVKHPKFDQACELIMSGQSRPNSKRYHRIWEKNEEGKYEAIELNFSNI